MMEKDYRDLWVMYYSYKKSEIQHRSLFYEDASPVFILNLDGRIIYHNKQASFLIKLQNKPLSYLNKGKLVEIFNEEHNDRIVDLIHHAMKGDIREDEFIFNYDEDSYNKEDRALGYIVRVEPIAWCTGNSIKITFHDISHIIVMRLMFAEQLKNLKLELIYFCKELERMYESRETPTKETLLTLNKLDFEFTSLGVLYIQFLGRLETIPEVFDIYVQAQNIIEKSFFKAESRGIDIVLTKDGELATVFADKTKYIILIQALMDFAISKAEDSSEVVLICGVLPPIEGQQVINFRLNFRSKRVTEEELGKLVQVRKHSTSRHTVKEIFNIVRNYGVSMAIVDTLLICMKGYIVDTYVQGDNSCKVGIIMQIPFTERKGRLDHKVLKLYPERVKIAGSNSGTIKWRASRGNLDRLLRPIPDYLDGSKVLMTQIQLVKRNARNKSSFKDSRELESQCNICIFPEKTSESLASPVLISPISMKVSLIRVPKPLVVESPISSPDISDVDEPLSQNVPSLRKPYRRRGPRYATHPKATYRANESLMNSQPDFKNFLSTPRSVIRTARALRSYTHNAQSLSPLYELPNHRIQKILSDNTDMHRTVEVLDFEPGPPRILLIESSEISRLAIGEQIKRVLECEQVIGVDGEEAVKEYLSYSKNGFMYFFILMETLMPNLDGYQTTQMIRSIEHKHGFPRTYIVGLSSEENPGSKYIDYGMDDLIKKPSTVKEFSKMITERKYLLGNE